MHWTGGAVAPGPVHWLTHFSVQCQHQCVGGYHLLSSLFESVTSGLLTNIREIVTLTQDLFRSVHLKQEQAMIIYRMVTVEGRCTMARSSSLGANGSLVVTKV